MKALKSGAFTPWQVIAQRDSRMGMMCFVKYRNDGNSDPASPLALSLSRVRLEKPGVKKAPIRIAAALNKAPKIQFFKTLSSINFLVLLRIRVQRPASNRGKI